MYSEKEYGMIPGFLDNGNWCLQYNNEPDYKFITVQQFLVRR